MTDDDNPPGPTPPDDTSPRAEYINTPQLAAWLAISGETLAQWRLRAEGPPFIKLGRHVRYSVAQVRSWLASNTRGAGARST